MVDQLTKKGQAILSRGMRRHIKESPAVLRAIARLESGGDLTPAMRDALETVEIPEAELSKLFVDAFNRGGRATSVVYRNLTSFNAAHPRASQWALRSAAERVQEINSVTRDGIRDMIARAMGRGVPPRQLAEQLRSSIGLTFRQTEMVADYRSRLMARGFASARANARAYEYGQSLLQQRLMAIAESEIVNAVESGKQEMWQQAVDDGLLPSDTQRVWIIEDDDRVCDICSLMAFATEDIYGYFDTPYGPQQHPPLHARCRCQVVIESERAKAGSVSAQLASSGGFTTHLVTGHTPPSGWMVAVPGHEVKMAYSSLNADWINEYKSASREMLNRPGHYWGGWVETSGGVRTVYLDVSRNVPNFDDAVALGRLYQQLAIYNIETGQTYSLVENRLMKRAVHMVGWIIPTEWDGVRVLREFHSVVDRGQA